MTTIIPIAFILIPLLAFCIQSIRERSKARSLTAFFLYGDELKAGRFMATLVSSNTAVGAVLFIIVVYGYWYGFGAIPWVIGFWIATQLASTWVLTHTEKTAKDGGENFIRNYGTLHEFLGASYHSKRVRIAAAIVSIVAYVILVAAEIVIATGIFSAILPEPTGGFLTKSQIALGLTVAVVTFVGLYSSLAGFRAVIKTDLIQLCLVVAMFGVFFYVLLVHDYSFFDFEAYTAVFPPVNTLEAYINGDGAGVMRFILFFGLANILFWGGWWPGAMDQWQRCAATRSTEISFHWLYGTVGLLPILYFSVLSSLFIGIGVIARLVGGDVVDSAPLFTYLAHFIETPLTNSLLIGVVAAGLAGALISTLDTYYVVMSQSLVSDVLAAQKDDLTPIEIDKDERLRPQYLRAARAAVLMFCVIGVLVAVLAHLLFEDIFSFIYIGFGVMFSLIPVIMLRVIRKNPLGDSRAAFYSIVLSAAYSLCFGGWLIFMIEMDYRSTGGQSVGAYYDILYFLSPMTALIGLVVYGVVKMFKPGDQSSATIESAQSGES